MQLNKLFLLFIIISVSGLSQNITIKDISTREPLQNVLLFDKNNKQIITDVKGKAKISDFNKKDSITIFLFNYAIKKIIIANDTTVDLSSKLVNLDEIVLSANRKPEHKIDVPFLIEIIKKKDIEFSNPATSGDLLSNTGQVFVQKSQAGGGSPSLRGFEANKVLLVIDGVRMNNAIYRGGHLQDVMTIDANMLDRTEVIFGPSSTIYGSDALGGVVHFYTKNAQFSSDDKILIKANAMLRYASAAQEKTSHLDFNLGWNKIASLTNITFSDFGNLRSGSNKLTEYNNTWDRAFYQDRINQRDTMIKNFDDNLQKGSGYSQIDIMQRFNIKTGKYITHNLNFQYGSSSFLPRYDRLNGDYSNGKFKFAENGYGPQKRLMAAYIFNYDYKTDISDNLKVILAYQKIDQDRITRLFQSLNRKTQMEDVSVLSVNIDTYKLIKNNHEVRYGIEFTNNEVQSTANFKNIFTNIETPADTRYAGGGNKMTTFAAYLSHAWEFSKNFVITDGIRFTRTSLKCEFTDTTFFKFPFTNATQNNQAVTGSLGFTWKLENDYKVSLLSNTGFRAPNVDDMSKVFESSTYLIVPNPTLKPEYTYNFEIGISKVIQSRYKFDFNAFYTNLTNVLVVSDYKLNGNDSAIYNGSNTKVKATQNIDNSYIYGFSGGAQFDFNDKISFKSVLNYTFGRYINSKLDTIIPLDHIAPMYGQTSISYKVKGFDGEFLIKYNGKKIISDYSSSGEDNLQYATINGTPSWFTLNIRLGANLTKNLRLNAACENITDNAYRNFASGINAPGRNIILSLRYKF